MGNAHTEKTKRRRARNPEKERERKRRQKTNRKKRELNPETRDQLKARLGTRRTKRLRKLFIRLSEAQNHRCCYCGCETWIPDIIDGVERFKWNRATKEHINPRSDGGTYGKYNLVMACSSCNNARGNKCYEEFIKLINKHPDYKDHVKRNAMYDKAKHDKAKLRQGIFYYHLTLYILNLTEEQRQTVNRWVEEKGKYMPVAVEEKRNKRVDRRNKSLSGIRRRVKKNAIALAP